MTQLSTPWETLVEAMLDADGTGALELRDALMRADPDRLAISLARLTADPAVDSAGRTKAAWLLKDTCAPLAVPFLEQALLAPVCPPSLREQILDTLERFAFGGPLPVTNLCGMNESLAPGREQELFASLLVALATEEAQDLLRQKLRQADLRPPILSQLASSPAPWIDDFLESVAAEDGGVDDVRAAIEQRGKQRQRDQLKAAGNEEPVGGALLSRLWAERDVALIAWLAEHGRLDSEAKRILLTLPEDPDLSRGQRKLLAQARSHADDH